MTTISRRTALTTAAAAFGLLPIVPRTSSGTLSTTQGGGLKFEVYKDTRGGFRWRLKAGNGKTIAVSGEAYKAKADCRNGIELIKWGASTASIEEVP